MSKNKFGSFLKDDIGSIGLPVASILTGGALAIPSCLVKVSGYVYELETTYDELIENGADAGEMITEMAKKVAKIAALEAAGYTGERLTKAAAEIMKMTGMKADTAVAAGGTVAGDRANSAIEDYRKEDQ